MAEIIHDLEITALVHGGRGIGHHHGKAVFVAQTMPGDRVRCEVVKSRRRFSEAVLHDVIDPAPLRRIPPCPFFGDCGGCQWQHLPYAEQLLWKQKIFNDFLLRSKLTSPDHIKPIVAAPEQWRYRSRVQLKCRFAQNRLKLGFYRNASHEIVDIDHCMLLSPPLQQTLTLLRSELPQMSGVASLTGIDAANGDDGAVRLVLHCSSRDSIDESWLCSFAHRHSLSICVQSGRDNHVALVAGSQELSITVDQPELRLRYTAGGFAQVNLAQNRAMVTAIIDLLDLKGTEQVLDLFCGMGNFSLPVARRAERVLGVEGHAGSIASARANAEANGLGNVEFRAADAAKLLSRLARSEHFDLALLDPPRSGSLQVAHGLLELKPRRILYVSCDPATLSRDLVPLVEQGYQILSSQPFDLFPQSWHCESVTLLENDKI